MRAKPNFHLGIHHVQQTEEYGHITRIAPPEKKSTDIVYSFIPVARRVANMTRIFKKIHTNHHEPVKALLFFESISRSLQLAAEGAFQHSDPEISARIIRMYRESPGIFQGLLRPPADDRDPAGDGKMRKLTLSLLVALILCPFKLPYLLRMLGHLENR